MDTVDDNGSWDPEAEVAEVVAGKPKEISMIFPWKPPFSHCFRWFRLILWFGITHLALAKLVHRSTRVSFFAWRYIYRTNSSDLYEPTNMWEGPPQQLVIWGSSASLALKDRCRDRCPGLLLVGGSMKPIGTTQQILICLQWCAPVISWCITTLIKYGFIWTLKF